MIKLDENYFINVEDKNNCTLTFSEQRTREKLDANRKKTGETEEYIFIDEWFYPNVSACLKKYVELKQKVAKDVSECISITEKLFAYIKTLN